MTFSLTLVVLAALMLLGVVFPPAVAFVYSLTFDVNDSWGVSSFLRTSGFETLVQWARAPVLVAALSSFLKIRRDHREGLAGSRPLVLASVLVACQAWILIGQLFKGEPYFSLPSFVTYTGLPAGLIALAYFRSRGAQILFVSAIAIQLTLSALLLASPSGPWSVLNARNYQMVDTELLGTRDLYEGGVARVGYQERVFAQHHNPQVYGLYAVVGSATGFYLLLSSARSASRLLGALLVGLGLFGWTVTVPRGATAGLFFGFGVVLWRMTRIRHLSSSKISRLTLVVCSCVVIALMFPSGWEGARTVFAISADDPGLAVRIEAAERAVGQMADYPLFGVPAAVFNADRVGIHQIMGYFAVMFGIPAGIACTWLLFISVRANAVSNKSRSVHATTGDLLASPEAYLCTLLMGVVLGMGITNNFGAAMLYWTAWAISCAPWIAGRSAENQAAHLRRLSFRPTLVPRSVSPEIGPRSIDVIHQNSRA